LPALDFCGGYAVGDGLGLPAFVGQYPDLVEPNSISFIEVP
jgi:hypothetical protein